MYEYMHLLQSLIKWNTFKPNFGRLVYLLFFLSAQSLQGAVVKKDILHYAIAINNINYSSKTISAKTVVSLQTTSAGDTLTLDLLGLKVDSVATSSSVSFFQKEEKLFVVFANAIAAGLNIQLSIYYSGAPKQDASWGGFYFSGVYAYNMGVGFTADPHNFGRVWFPCVDNFIDKASYSFAITAPAGYKALCNGNLDSVNTITNTYYWHINQSIPTYLASVAIAPYTVHYDDYKGTPITLAALASDSIKMLQSFVHLKDAIAAFESKYGQHRFDRVGFNVVPFTGGAMEHATNIAYPLFGVDGTLDNETLYAHELSHHWWGNNVTCSDQQFMWINEGWASYSERIFLEWVYGKDRYNQDISENHRNILHYAHLRDGKAWPVSGVDHARTYGMHVYQKGADMVHTLRGYMGDEAFFKATIDFMETYAYGNATTTDLKNVFQKHTSENLTLFFKYWIESPGSTAFSVLEWQTREVGPLVKTDIRIKQNLRMAPALYTQVPFEITLMDKSMNKEVHKVYLSGLDSTYSISGSLLPVFIGIDMDGKLSDAITDKHYVTSSSGELDMVDAMMKIQVKAIKDSALVRVEHFWTSPDHFYNVNKGLQLSTRRYWRVDGIWPEGFNASATIEYNGRVTGTNYAAGYLDDDLVILNEDSLVLMYRPHAAAQWQVENNIGRDAGTVLDRKGIFTIHQLKKGEYALAIYNNKGTIGVDNNKEVAFRIYPNPSDSDINLEFEPLASAACLEIIDVNGKVVKQIKLKSGTAAHTIKSGELKPGMYWMGISVNNLAYQPKRVLVK
jgi:hypothetical protein